MWGRQSARKCQLHFETLAVALHAAWSQRFHQQNCHCLFAKAVCFLQNGGKCYVWQDTYNPSVIFSTISSWSPSRKHHPNLLQENTTPTYSKKTPPQPTPRKHHPNLLQAGFCLRPPHPKKQQQKTVVSTNTTDGRRSHFHSSSSEMCC